MDLSDVKERIGKLPSEIKDEELKLRSVEQTINELRRDKKRLEMNTTQQVSTETGEDGKRRYTNAETREAAVHDYLAGNEAYRELLEHERKNEATKSTTIIEIDYLKRELKSIELLLKALELE
jgi:PBP1b-binding outer membrane lipoprotein LpoB